MRRVVSLWLPLALTAVIGGCTRSEPDPQQPAGRDGRVSQQTAPGEAGRGGAATEPAPGAAESQESEATSSAEPSQGDPASGGSDATGGSVERPTPETISPSIAGQDAPATRDADTAPGGEGSPAAPVREDSPGGEPAPSDAEPSPVGEPLEKEEPLLLLDEETPLLLDGGDQALSGTSGPAADNSRCHVCHLNFMQEELALTHAEANIGCANCHGDSDAHIADESWASGGNGTAPDTMFPKEKINSFCLTCHPKEEIVATKQHKLVFADDAEDVYCTDCHGDHRLDERKCKWK